MPPSLRTLAHSDMSPYGAVGATRTRGYVLFRDFEMVQLLADGLQVALLGHSRQEGLHAVVELVFAVELG